MLPSHWIIAMLTSVVSELRGLTRRWTRPSPGVNQGRFSSAGRASDWRSEGPVFDPRRWHNFLRRNSNLHVFIRGAKFVLDSHLSWTLCYYIIIWYPAAFLGWSLIVTLIIIWGPSWASFGALRSSHRSRHELSFVRSRMEMIIIYNSSRREWWSRRSGRLVQCAFRLFGVIITKINVNGTDPNFVITITSRISRETN